MYDLKEVNGINNFVKDCCVTVNPFGPDDFLVMDLMLRQKSLMMLTVPIPN